MVLGLADHILMVRMVRDLLLTQVYLVICVVSVTCIVSVICIANDCLCHNR